ncbi:MAG: hypothetical protein V2A73_17440, partial [Pseudomonadota bacterium]
CEITCSKCGQKIDERHCAHCGCIIVTGLTDPVEMLERVRGIIAAHDVIGWQSLIDDVKGLQERAERKANDLQFALRTWHEEVAAITIQRDGLATLCEGVLDSFKYQAPGARVSTLVGDRWHKWVDRLNELRKAEAKLKKKHAELIVELQAIDAMVHVERPEATWEEDEETEGGG